MTKCFFIHSSVWLIIPKLFNSRGVQLPFKVVVVLIAGFTVFHTLTTTTQEESSQTILLSSTISLILPSLLVLAWLAKWFSMKRRARDANAKISRKELIRLTLTSYSVLMMLLVELSSLMVLLTMAGDKEVFWAMFGLNCINSVVMASNPLLVVLFISWDNKTDTVLSRN